MPEPQEARTSVVSFRVTPTEKRRLDLLLQVREERGEAAQEGLRTLFAPALQELLHEAEGYRRQLAGLS